MRFHDFSARPVLLAVVLVFGFALTVSAQDVPADQPQAAPGTAPETTAAKPSGPTRKPVRPAPKPSLKAGEIVPMDQTASGDSSPAPAAARPAAPVPAAAPAVPDAVAPAPAAENPSSGSQAAPQAPAVNRAQARAAARAAAKEAKAAKAAGVAPVPAGEPSDTARTQAPAPASAAAPETQEATPAAAPAIDAAQAPGRMRPQKTPLTQARPRSPGGTLTIGALLPLTGPLAAQGHMSKEAVDLAVADINAYLTESGSSERVSVQVEDTASAGSVALERLKGLAVSGVHLVLGPYSDNEVDSVLDFASKNGIILLSQGSAGPYLAKPGRSLFRFAPSDAFQAESVAVLANQEGATQLISIWGGDMYGDELVTHVKGQFANLGGQVIAGTRFRPETEQFASFVADLKSQIDKNVKDKKKLAIFVAARGAQTAGILREAAKIPGLSDAKWYGCDDSALRGSITEDQDVAKYAAQVRMAFARYGETGTAMYSDLEKRIEDRIHAFVDTQAVVAYDVIWLATMTAMTSGDDPAALRKAIPVCAEHFFGASGWLALNENGDRRENYDFDFWTIKNMDGKYYWVKTARYQFDPGSGKQLILNSPDK